MRFDLDQAFGIHEDALLLRSRRAQVLAENLANADTPNYKARDLDFHALLQNVTQNGDSAGLNITHPDHIQTESAMRGGEVMYRNPLQPSLDGNTVDTQTEKAEFLRNAMGFQTSMKFLDGTIKTLLSAIKGE